VILLKRTLTYHGDAQSLLLRYPKYKLLKLTASTPEVSFTTTEVPNDVPLIVRNYSNEIQYDTANIDIDSGEYAIDMTDTLQKNLDIGGYEIAFARAMEMVYSGAENLSLEFFDQLSLVVSVTVTDADGNQRGQKTFRALEFLTPVAAAKAYPMDGTSPVRYQGK